MNVSARRFAGAGEGVSVGSERNSTSGLDTSPPESRTYAPAPAASSSTAASATQMTIRRRDRGLSGDDMGCDGSWDMTDDLLERLREVPGAGELLGTLAGVPGVWVVGGAVRDALLGRQPRDLDLVVEGDAAEVARRLGEAPLLHERFGTATANGVVNLAAARRERYEQPGALPEVELGAPIAEDLARRDFTVNAIAVRLADGELRAVPHALEDLAARRLRVLNAGSFLDDPTRLLRLVRYAARLRFQIEKVTRDLAFA